MLHKSIMINHGRRKKKLLAYEMKDKKENVKMTNYENELYCS